MFEWRLASSLFSISSLVSCLYACFLSDGAALLICAVAKKFAMKEMERIDMMFTAYANKTLGLIEYVLHCSINSSC